jgi:SAM-dependent methyltransferase
VRFRPGNQDDLAPSGEVARIRANLAAIGTLRTIQAGHRPATEQEQRVLARWSGWGAVPAALDTRNDKYAWVRDELGQLLDETELAVARRTTLNAHYTDAALVDAIWSGLARLGLSGGRVLEPGCGSGNFIGFAPEGVQMVGVELDPTTAAIAASLYPHAQVLAESFADTRAPEGSFDAAVGNVPFGNVRLHDKRHNAGKHTIHNHFIIKSLRLVRPGGLVAVITSAYTMDAANPGARREMQQLADLVGAVRLPTRAHTRAAGTEALTDVLVFRRREADRAPQPFTWEYTHPVQVGEAMLRINSHFLDRPEMLLGELATGDGVYRADELSVTGDPQRAPAQLAEALAQLAAEARAAGLMTTAPDPARQVARPAALLPAHDQHPTGYLRALPDATFTRQGQEDIEPYQPPKTQAAELRALLRLRDAVLTLLEAEAATVDDTDEVDQLRERLNRGYDSYVRRFGPINRFTLRPVTRLDSATGQRLPACDEHTGQPKARRVQPPQGGFHTDPYAPLVWGLEHFDDQTQTAAKADIFRQRVVAPRPPRLGADTPADALAMVTDELGEVRLDRVAWLLGVDETDARQQLGTLVFDDPVTGALEPAAAYLSGDVREKLTAARQAAETDPRLEANVTALAQVLPRDLGPDEIAIQMGAPWIHERYVQRFLAEILDDPTAWVEHGAGSMWSVSSSRDHTVEATSTWGTARVSASGIAQHVLEQRPIRVFDTHRIGGLQRRVPNLEETVAANEKAAEMRERFAEWAWEDPQRTAELWPSWCAPTTTPSIRTCCAATTTRSCRCPGWQPRSSPGHISSPPSPGSSTSPASGCTTPWGPARPRS